MDCSPPGSSVHEISQARILEQVAISFSRGSSWPRDQTYVSYIGRGILHHWVTREAGPWAWKSIKWISSWPKLSDDRQVSTRGERADSGDRNDTGAGGWEVGGGWLLKGRRILSYIQSRYVTVIKGREKTDANCWMVFYLQVPFSCLLASLYLKWPREPFWLKKTFICKTEHLRTSVSVSFSSQITWPIFDCHCTLW